MWRPATPRTLDGLGFRTPYRFLCAASEEGAPRRRQAFVGPQSERPYPRARQHSHCLDQARLALPARPRGLPREPVAGETDDRNLGEATGAPCQGKRIAARERARDDDEGGLGRRRALELGDASCQCALTRTALDLDRREQVQASPVMVGALSAGNAGLVAAEQPAAVTGRGVEVDEASGGLYRPLEGRLTAPPVVDRGAVVEQYRGARLPRRLLLTNHVAPALGRGGPMNLAEVVALDILTQGVEVLPPGPGRLAQGRESGVPPVAGRARQRKRLDSGVNEKVDPSRRHRARAGQGEGIDDRDLHWPHGVAPATRGAQRESCAPAPARLDPAQCEAV